MRSVQDALYNWLTIKVVFDARPDDTAAKETVEMFEDILKNEHHVSNIEVTKDETMYYISYSLGDEVKKTRYPREYIEVTLNSINQHPERYENYPSD